MLCEKKRLKRLELFDLEKKMAKERHKAYKIMYGVGKAERVDLSSFLITLELGVSNELLSRRYRADKRKYFFAQCIIDGWNSKKPGDVIMATHLKIFQKGLGKSIEVRSITD